MSQPAWLMYKCRMCDLKFPACRVPDGPLALAVIEAKAPTPTPWRGQLPGQLTLHHDCPDGSLGVADLSGASPIDETEGDEPDDEGDDDDF
jgi:hypothetical protein